MKPEGRLFLQQQTLVYLDERSLGEFLVDLRFVHDVLGPAGVLQRAQCFLQKQT